MNPILIIHHLHVLYVIPNHHRISYLLNGITQGNVKHDTLHIRCNDLWSQVKGLLIQPSLRDQPLTLYRLFIWDLYAGHPMHRYHNEHPHTNLSTPYFSLRDQLLTTRMRDMQCVLVSRCSTVSSPVYTSTIKVSKNRTIMCNLDLTIYNLYYKFHLHGSHSFGLYLISE